jgi:hypothetical protein
MGVNLIVVEIVHEKDKRNFITYEIEVNYHSEKSQNRPGDNAFLVFSLPDCILYLTVMQNR